VKSSGMSSLTSDESERQEEKVEGMERKRRSGTSNLRGAKEGGDDTGGGTGAGGTLY
jgi:hypothetical protein